MEQPMPWEYCTHAITLTNTLLQSDQFDQTELTRVLNDLGEQNWELVSSFTTRYMGRSYHLVHIDPTPFPHHPAEKNGDPGSSSTPRYRARSSPRVPLSNPPKPPPTPRAPSG